MENLTYLISMLLFCFAWGQNMDPKVTIKETVPKAKGRLVMGTISKDVTLDCLVEDLMVDKQVWWVRTMSDKSGRNLTTPISKDTDVNDNNEWSIEKPSPYRWRLRIKALRVEDEGTYWCYVELNRDVRVQDWKTVLATEAPLIIEAKTTSDLTAKEDEMVKLVCAVSGRPQPTVMWRREGNAVLPGGGVMIMHSELEIENIKYTDRGRYMCEGYNEVGHTMRTITLKVQYSPKVKANPAQVAQVPGYMRTLTCISEANPPPNTDVKIDNPQLRFIKNGQTIINSDRHEVSVLEGAYSMITFELTIFQVQESDYGVYECRATNIFSSGSSHVELIKSDVIVEDKGGQTSSAEGAYPHMLITITSLLSVYLLSIFI